MLRVHFAPSLGATDATFEIPFAGLRREAEGREVPALRWSDLSEQNGDYGFSLLNDSKYGYQADGGDLSLTLLRASYEPDLNPDEGLHTFIYSIFPHPGGWTKAETIKKAAELNQPAFVKKTNSHSGKNKPGKARLACQSDSILVSAFKLAEDQPGKGSAYVIRLYESHGKAGKATLVFDFPVVDAFETDLMEQPQSHLPLLDGSIDVDFSPFEIKTLMINCT